MVCSVVPFHEPCLFLPQDRSYFAKYFFVAAQLWIPALDTNTRAIHASPLEKWSEPEVSLPTWQCWWLHWLNLGRIMKPRQAVACGAHCSLPRVKCGHFKSVFLNRDACLFWRLIYFLLYMFGISALVSSNFWCLCGLFGLQLCEEGTLSFLRSWQSKASWHHHSPEDQ